MLLFGSQFVLISGQKFNSMTSTVLDSKCRPKSKNSTAFTMNHLRKIAAIMVVEVSCGLAEKSEDKYLLGVCDRKLVVMLEVLFCSVHSYLLYCTSAMSLNALAMAGRSPC